MNDIIVFFSYFKITQLNITTSDSMNKLELLVCIYTIIGVKNCNQGLLRCETLLPSMKKNKKRVILNMYKWRVLIGEKKLTCHQC